MDAASSREAAKDNSPGRQDETLGQSHPQEFRADRMSALPWQETLTRMDNTDNMIRYE